MEIQSIRRLVEVRKEKDMILDEERRIESHLSNAYFECDLFFNMFKDTYTEDEDWNYYLWQKFNYHGSKVCLFEEEEDMIKEKKKKWWRRNDFEETVRWWYNWYNFVMLVNKDCLKQIIEEKNK